MRRREFLKRGVLLGASWCVLGMRRDDGAGERAPAGQPMVVSTWSHGLAANREAWRVLAAGGSAIDAVERGVRVPEADPKVTSVGLGGLPNREGQVQLDAALMDGRSLRAGAVAALERIRHPVSVARRVMEKTPHILLVGEGALRFARDQGFAEEDLLTPESRAAWEKWRAEEGARGVAPRSEGRPGRGIGDHDTIGMLAIDRTGNMAAATSTSGLAWKLPGRVGDSPLVGHGLYCDSQVGGAVATGVGEEVIRVCGAASAVFAMAAGRSPQEAVLGVLERILRVDPENRGRQIALVALRKDGAVGYAAMGPGFQVALSRGGTDELLDSPVAP